MKKKGITDSDFKKAVLFTAEGLEHTMEGYNFVGIATSEGEGMCACGEHHDQATSISAIGNFDFASIVGAIRGLSSAFATQMIDEGISPYEVESDFSKAVRKGIADAVKAAAKKDLGDMLSEDAMSATDEIMRSIFGDMPGFEEALKGAKSKMAKFSSGKGGKVLSGPWVGGVQDLINDPEIPSQIKEEILHRVKQVTGDSNK